MHFPNIPSWGPIATLKCPVGDRTGVQSGISAAVRGIHNMPANTCRVKLGLPFCASQPTKWWKEKLGRI
jgi:hypothetical protein